MQEFNLEDIPDIECFEAQAATYSRVEHVNLIKIEALFYDKVRICAGYAFSECSIKLCVFVCM